MFRKLLMWLAGCSGWVDPNDTDGLLEALFEKQPFEPAAEQLESRKTELDIEHTELGPVRVTLERLNDPSQSLLDCFIELKQYTERLRDAAEALLAAPDGVTAIAELAVLVEDGEDVLAASTVDSKTYVS